MDSRAKEVIRIGNKAFGDKETVDSLWQEIALNFYPERANFTTERIDGEEYSDHLFSSFPVLARRELANLFASNLRPRTSKWFSIHVPDEKLDEGIEERKYLDYLSDVQWRKMYEPSAKMVKATKEGDHDFAAFGNAVIQTGPNVARTGLLFKNYHLRDNAWSDNAENEVDCNHRNWKPTARQLKHLFPDTISQNVKKACEQEPDKVFKCRHVVMPSRLYDYKGRGGKRFPFISLFVELESETVLEEVGMTYFPYVIPRWQTVSDSQYGQSMATNVALPDGRTTQVVLRVLREAGEKYVDPPMIAVMDAIRSDLALYAGGVTNADIEYDEKLGEVLRPISQDRSGMPIGFEIANALKTDITAAFFLDKIQLPETNTDMTAFEVRRRIEQHVRSAAPLFEPIEADYNQPLCENSFHILQAGGAFGPPEWMPESLRGQDLRYSFRSPINDMADANEAEIFQGIMQTMLIPAAQMDPALLETADVSEALRDAMRAAGWKPTWFKPKEAVEAKRAELMQQMEQMQQMEAAGKIAEIAETGSKGAKTIQEMDSEAT
jgi:hypothetical protein